MLLVFLLLASAAPAAARAGSFPVVELDDSPVAGTSSIRVGDFVGDGTRTNGRVLGFDPSDGEYSCSGTALDTPSRSIVLTAGHCVQERHVIGRRLVFIPAYDHGNRPFGTFEVKAAYMMRQWRRHENPDFDVAALKVTPNQNGKLTDVVGGRGYVIRRSRHLRYRIYGYPAAAVNGEELRSCVARGLGSDVLTYRFFGPPTVPSSCDMASGSSGGAWIVSGAYVNGVTSYGYAGRGNKVYSPYFGPQIGRFLAKLP